MNAELSTLRPRLVRRIHRFLTVFERYGRNPNRREGYYTLLAIECLRAERYEEGEQAMLAAETLEAIPPERATLPGPHDEATTADLRTALRSAIREQPAGEPRSSA